MKIASLLFFGGLLAIFCFDFFYKVVPQQDFNRQPTEHPLTKALVAAYEQPLDGTTGPRTEKAYRMGYIYRLTVYPGFRVTHDPTLGDEILVTTTAVGHEMIGLSGKEGHLNPRFTRPVRLSEYVDVRVNLEAHGSQEMRIVRQQPRRAGLSLPPDFTTAGPLTFKVLELQSTSKNLIEVQAENLIVPATKPLEQLRGTAEKMELLYEEESERKTVPPGLSVGQLLHTYLTE